MNRPAAEHPDTAGSDTARAVRRILVALDASAHSLAAVEAAARLAEKVDAELEGLFVEDVNLIRLARLELAREIDVLSARLRDLESQQLERQLRRGSLASAIEGRAWEMSSQSFTSLSLRVEEMNHTGE